MWFEELPESCPPLEAKGPKNFVVFRMVRADCISCTDFWSQRKEQPTRKFRNIDECRVRSLSVFDEYERCDRITKLPLHRGKRVAKITLDSSSGVVMQTGQDKHHYSWWRKNDFEPHLIADLVEEGSDA